MLVNKPVITRYFVLLYFIHFKKANVLNNRINKNKPSLNKKPNLKMEVEVINNKGKVILITVLNFNSLQILKNTIGTKNTNAVFNNKPAIKIEQLKILEIRAKKTEYNGGQWLTKTPCSSTIP